MIVRRNAEGCDCYQGSAIQLPDAITDETELYCPVCGGSLGTIESLRKLLEDALGDDKIPETDNDN